MLGVDGTDVLGSELAQAAAGETAASRAFVRPVADNVICLIVSPQQDSKATTGPIAPSSRRSAMARASA